MEKLQKKILVYRYGKVGTRFVIEVYIPDWGHRQH